MTAVVAIGGGHGLACTLRACRPWADELTAIVSVADDGGSSGRLRASTGLPAPGDLRRCLTGLADPTRATLARALERRFDGHAAGNLLLAGLAAEPGADLAAAARYLGDLLGVPDHVRVLPASTAAVELTATLADGSTVRGQVAVEEAGGIDRVAVEPADASAPPDAVDAVERADLVVLGPGSLYGSVLAAAVVPDLADALAKTAALTVFVCNLRPRHPETAGYDVAAHVDALHRHGIEPDAVLTDPGGLPAGGIEVIEAPIAKPSGLAHDPERLGEALRRLFSDLATPRVGSAGSHHPSE